LFRCAASCSRRYQEIGRDYQCNKRGALQYHGAVRAACASAKRRCTGRWSAAEAGIEEPPAMMIAAIWIAGTLVVAVIAASRNRSALGWTLLSLVISPLLAIMAVALLPPVPGKQPPPPPVDRLTARLSDMRLASRPVLETSVARRPRSAREIGRILGIAAALALVVWMASRPWHVYWTPSGPWHLDPAMDESPHWYDSSPRLASAPTRVLIEIPAPDPAAAGRMLDDRALATSRLTPLN
jgi:hypothetical protein